MVKIKHKGDFKKTIKFLNGVKNLDFHDILSKYGSEGVAALSAATPVDSGETAAAWSFEITSSKGSATITWTNSHVNKGVNIALILQYGHGTGTGGYVEGRDYINPAIQPVFDRIAESAWQEVSKL